MLIKFIKEKVKWTYYIKRIIQNWVHDVYQEAHQNIKTKRSIGYIGTDIKKGPSEYELYKRGVIYEKF